MMLRGLGVGEGIAIGRAIILSDSSGSIRHITLSHDWEVEQEVIRFLQSVSVVDAELVTLLFEPDIRLRGELSAFIYLQRMILADPMLIDETCTLIKRQKINAEWALLEQSRLLSARFQTLSDEYIREKAQDIQQVTDRVLRALRDSTAEKTTSFLEEPGPVIVVAVDLSPADIVRFCRTSVVGFITEKGSLTSHSLIIANSLGIPALVSVSHARFLIYEQEWLILDVHTGAIVVGVEADHVQLYRKKHSSVLYEAQRRQLLLGARTQTRDHIDVGLYANLDVEQEVSCILPGGAQGIGLLRTEFMFLERLDLPSEDEQFEVYRRVISEMQGARVTIRTLDIGADKLPQPLTVKEDNPALGFRGIRFCLKERHIFLVQLCAILRAASYGSVRLLIPMISSEVQVVHFCALLKQAKAMLAERHYVYSHSIAVGLMVEIPAAVFLLKSLLRYFDFVCVGSNDLAQYLLAVDRNADGLLDLYDLLHPAVLKMLYLIARTCQHLKKSATVCGEIAGDVTMTRLLLGMGFREFSMHVSRILPVKERILDTSVQKITPLVKGLLRQLSPDCILSYLERVNAES